MFRRLAAIAAIALSVAACHKPPPKAPEASANAAFLAKNAKEAGVTTLPDGLQYKIVTSGPAGGEKPRAQDEVKANYEGSLIPSGEVFDASAKHGGPQVFPLDQVIPGWTEVMQLMKPGDEWIVWIPPELAYGADGRPGIPPNSVLKFRIQLIGVLKHDAPPARA